MTKYKVYLADNYNLDKPFTTDWDYELLGDKLRAEFDVYFEKQEQAAGAGTGQTNQLIKGEYVKKFMLSKRINLVSNPNNDALQSVFILKKDEKKVIDGRAKATLASRFEYKTRINSDGTETSPTGFMKFDLIEGIEDKSEKEVETLQVSGNDIQYFEEESQKEEKNGEEVEKEKSFACNQCEKEFETKKALDAHKLSHKK